MTAMSDPAGFVRLAPPPLTPPTINLVTSSRNPSPVDPVTGEDVPWQLGFAFEPIPNVNPTAYDFRAGGAGANDSPPSMVQCAPWVAEVLDRCSSIGFRAHDFVNRALAGLRAATPKAVEAEFWSGTVAQAANFPNLYLASAAATDVTPVAGTAVSQAEAFELLEQAIADSGCGGRGMIHVPARLTPILTGVRREGNLLLTARDTIVVAGSGYSGSGPVGNAHVTPSTTKVWAYATGVVSTYIGDPYVENAGDEVRLLTARQSAPAGAEPGDDSALNALYTAADEAGLDDTFRSYFLDRSVNLVTARARRPVAATWDGICHAAVYVNINT